MHTPSCEWSLLCTFVSQIRALHSRYTDQERESGGGRRRRGERREKRGERIEERGERRGEAHRSSFMSIATSIALARKLLANERG